MPTFRRSSARIGAGAGRAQHRLSRRNKGRRLNVSLVRARAALAATVLIQGSTVVLELSRSAPLGEGAGDRSRADRLVRVYAEHWPRVFRLCLSLLRNESDAEDAAQETFARAVERIDSVYGEVGAYLMTVARHICYRELARRARRGGELDAEMSADGPAADLQAAERSLLIKVWAMLSPRHRTILAHSFAGYSYDEIARITGLSVSAVTSKLWRARQRARELADGVASGFLLPGVLWRAARRRCQRAFSGARGRALGDPSLPAALAGVQQLALLGTAVVVVVAAGGGSSRADGPPPHAGLASTAAQLPDRGDRSAPAPATSRQLSHIVAAPPPASSSGARWQGNGGASGFMGGLTDHGSQATQEQTTIRAFTPASGAPGTAFFSGTVAPDCNSTCLILFRTDDGGHTWTSVNHLTFPGGTVLLPPSFPATSTIFTFTGSTLAQNDAAGVGDWRQVSPALAAAIDPTSTPDDTRVVLATPQIVVYHSQSGLFTPGPTVPAGLGVPSSILPTTDGAVLIAVQQPSAQQVRGWTTVVERCPALGPCSQVLEVPGAGVNLVPSASFAFDHSLAAFTSSHAYLSSDGGVHFREMATGVAAPTLSSITLVTTSACPSTCVFATGVSLAGGYNTLSVDGGATFSHLGALLSPVLASGFLGDGNLLAGLQQPDVQGLGARCSSNLGVSWALYC